MSRRGLELAFFIQQLTIHLVCWAPKQKNKSSSGWKSSKNTFSLFSGEELWPSNNSKDSIPYWEKLHNHFWLEREHLWRALSLSFKVVWRVSANGCFSRENSSLNSKINFIFIFTRKPSTFLGGGACLILLRSLISENWCVLAPKSSNQISHDTISSKSFVFLRLLFSSDRGDSLSLYSLIYLVWVVVWQIGVNGVRLRDNLI